MGKDSFRSSHSHIFFKTDVLNNFAVVTGKHLCWSLFSIETLTQVYSFEYCKLSKNSFITERLRWLLLMGHILNFRKVAFVIDAYV